MITFHEIQPELLDIRTGQILNTQTSTPMTMEQKPLNSNTLQREILRLKSKN